jgi:uncharacterized protein (TIGR02599 family)
VNSPLPPAATRRPGVRGVTLIELLAAVAIMAVILTVIFGITQQTGNAWRSTNSKIDAFQGARAAFETITQLLGQATLNVYYDYYDAQGERRTAANAETFAPSSYGRYSDLHFLSGKSLVPNQITHGVFFQTPAGYSDAAADAGLETLLNSCGFFVVESADPARPAFLDNLPHPPPTRNRHRLMQFLQPSRKLAVYASGTGRAWLTDAMNSATPPTRQIAENIIALVVRPRRSDQDPGPPLAPFYEYDSRAGSSNPQGPTQHQLPPLVDIVMVAIDENSARRLEEGPGVEIADLFSSAADLDDDLRKLEERLSDRRLTYRVFRTTVAMRNAKWSSS